MTGPKLLKFDEIFKGDRVPQWLRLFEAAPTEAIGDLLTGRASLGALDADEPSSVLIDWLNGIGGEFAVAADDALAAWIAASWGECQLERAGKSAAVTAVAWCRAGEVIAAVESFHRSADTLKSQLLDDRRFLNDLHQGRSRDPLGRAWFALARHQHDRDLVSEWWRLCSLPPEESWYRGAYGIAGLRGLPPADGEGGGFRTEVAEGLVALGAGLEARSRLGNPDPVIARDEFLHIATLAMAAFPFSKLWNEFWREEAPDRQTRVPEAWLRKLLGGQPKSGSPGGPRKRKSATSRWCRKDPNWSVRSQNIVARLRLQPEDHNAIQDAQTLLQEELNYARVSGDGRHFALSACNISRTIFKVQPKAVLDWLRLARIVYPSNPHSWTQSVKTLLTVHRLEDALALATESVERFPGNAVARTGLAEVLRALQRFPEAEMMYREIVDRFPFDVVARYGLARVLRVQGRFAEAEATYREIIGRFPRSVIARHGLAGLLSAQGRFSEAEEISRRTISQFNDDLFARHDLARILRRQSRFREAEETCRETLERFPTDSFAMNGLAELLSRRKQFGEAESWYRLSLSTSPDDVYAMVGLAGVLLKTGSESPDEAVGLLQKALKIDPANSVAQSQLKAVGATDIAMTEAADAEWDSFVESAILIEPLDWDEDDSGLFAASVRPKVSSPGIKGEITHVPKVPQTPEKTTDDSVVTHNVASKVNATENRDSSITEAVALPHKTVLPDEARILLTDATLVRRWARSMQVNTDATVPGEWQHRGQQLFEQLSDLWKHDGRIASEAGLLAITTGNLEAAINLLREAVHRFPGSSRVRLALARAERELAQAEQLSYSDAVERQVIAPWRGLGRCDTQLLPVQHLGSGRAWLALKDNPVVRNNALSAFGRLAHWTNQFVRAVGRDTSMIPVQNTDSSEAESAEYLLRRFELNKEADSFSSWWAREVQVYVFGQDDITGADSIDERHYAAIVKRILRNSPIVDSLEEEFVRRLAA